jgi:chromosome partitioning protein
MIVSLTGGKGGIGKTTLAVCLAAEAVQRGKRALLVDLDDQRSASQWGDAAVALKRPAPNVVSMTAGMLTAGALAAIVGEHDPVLLDCPGRHDEVTRAALLCSDVAILPCGPGSFDAWALASSIELIARARALRPALKAYIVVAKKKPRSALSASARDELGACGLPVLKTEVYDRVAYPEATGFGLGVTTYEPKSPAADEIRALYDEIFGTSKPAKKGLRRG